MTPRTVLMFPGQGAYFPGALTEARRLFPNEVDSVLATVDDVAAKELGEPVSKLLTTSTAPSIEELLQHSNASLQLAIYATSLASFEILKAAGARPHALLGHSFGEISALAAAGAFSVADGACIVCDRTRALLELPADSGYMVALSTNAATASHLVGLAGGPAAVAVENEPGQTVVSGAPQAMDRLLQLASVMGLTAVRLDAAYPFHSPVLESAVVAFERRLRKYPHQPSAAAGRIFSPILGRYYEPSDDLAARLAAHLVTPVRFSAALENLARDGANIFVECGARATLSRLAQRVLDGKGAFLPMFEVGKGQEGLDKVLATVRAAPSQAAFANTSVPHLFERFWAERQDQVRAVVQGLFEDFVRDGRCETSERAASVDVYSDEAASSVAFDGDRPAASPSSSHPGSSADATRHDRDGILRELIELYATALEYPKEVFDENVSLEAELGVDSVKQTELFGRIADKYGLPPSPSGVRLSDYQRLGDIADLVAQSLQVTTTAERAKFADIETAPRESGVETRSSSGSREDVLARLRRLYAEALEYPEEVFGDDVELEAELGVDSVKQTELFGRVAQMYGLSAPTAGFKLSDYQTLGRIADLVNRLASEAGDQTRRAA